MNLEQWTELDGFDDPDLITVLFTSRHLTFLTIEIDKNIWGSKV